MRRLGITRKVDGVGRVTLPRSLREGLDIDSGTEVEFLREGQEIILRKIDKAGHCVICGQKTENKVKGASLCKKCIDEIMME